MRTLAFTLNHRLTKVTVDPERLRSQVADRHHRGVGVACSIDVGTYVALIAEVEVDKATGHVKVSRVVCAQDMGVVVNPEGALPQAEGRGFTSRP